MDRKRFMQNAGALCGTALATNLIGTFFRIYFTNIAGAHATGVLSLVITVYLLCVTFTTNGVTLCVTRAVADARAKADNSSIQIIVQKSLVFSVLLACAVGASLYAFAPFIGGQWLCDTATVKMLRMLALSLPFMSVSACLRGYFYAQRSALKTAGEQLIEQAVEVLVFMAVFISAEISTAEQKLMLLMISTTIAEVMSCGYSYAMYRADIKKLRRQTAKHDASKNNRTLLNAFERRSRSIMLEKGFFAIWLPVTASGVLRSGLSLCENVMIPVGLRAFGENSVESLATYGRIAGMALPLLLFPNMFLICFSSLMIPELELARAKKRTKGIEYMTSRIVRFSLLFVFAVSACFFACSQQISGLFYNDAQIGLYVRLLAPACVLLYLDKIVDGMLKGLNEQVSYLIFNIIDSVVRVLLTFVLIPRIGIVGIIVMIYVSAILNTGLSLWRLVSVAQVRIEIARCVVTPLAISVVSAGVTALFFKTIWAIPAYFALFSTLTVLTKNILSSEISWLKGIFSELFHISKGDNKLLIDRN